MSTAGTPRIGVRRMPRIGVRVPPRDAINVLAESDHVIANLVDVLVVDAAGTDAADLTHDVACAWMRARLDVDPVFRRRMRRRFADLGDPFWITDREVDVADHVVVERITEPGWSGVERHIAHVMATPMVLERSTWEIHFLTGIRDVAGVPDGATVVVVKVHHSSMDGLGLVSVMRALFADPGMAHGGATSTPRGGSAPTMMRPLWREAASSVPRAIAFVRAMSASRRAMAPRAHPPRPATRFNSRITLDHRIRVLFLDLPRIRAIKRAVPEVTVNDILLTAVSLAMSRYLHDKGEEPVATLSTTMPLDIDGAVDSPAANRTTFVDVDLHTTEPEPMQRLRAVHGSASEAKNRVKAMLDTHTVGPFDVAPASVLRVIGALSTMAPHDRPTVPSNTVVSNMPHGNDALWFLGAPAVSAFMPMPTVDGMGLIHHVTSLGRRVSVTVTVDSTMMADPDPDPDRYMRYLDDALVVMEGAAALAAEPASTPVPAVADKV